VNDWARNQHGPGVIKMIKINEVTLVKCILITHFILCGCSKPEDFLNTGNQLFQSGDYEKAIIEYQKAITKNPKFTDAYYQIGIIQLKQNNHNEALVNFEKILEIDPKYRNAYIKLAEIYMNKNNLDEADKLLQAADRVIPNDNEILTLWITVLLKKIETSPSESLYLTLGEVYDKALKYEEASIQYSRVIKINPRNETALFRLAKSLESAGNYSAAIEKYKNIPKDSSLFPQSQERICDIQEMQGYKGAIWGMNTTQVSKSLQTSLQKGWGIGIFGEWPTNFCFYELWGVSKTEFMGFSVYANGEVPQESFRYMITSEGDKCLFYRGKFCCYYFDVKAKNYDTYYNTLVSKYGSPSSRSFTVYLEDDYQKTEPHNLTVNTWQKGSTRIFLLKDYNEIKTMGIAFTMVKILYFSDTIFKQIENEIHRRIDTNREIEREKEKRQEKDDLEKLQ